MFNTLTESFTSAIKKIRFHDDDKALSKALLELKKNLLKADVNHKVVKELIEKVQYDTKANGIGKDQFLDALRKALYELLEIGGSKGFIFAPNPPTVILMTGLQGSGKTTTTGKLANYLKNKQKKVMIVAADLQRLAGVEQLRQISAQIEVELYEDETSKNPVEVVNAALKKARNGIYDVVLIDTAGRLAIDDALMNELEAVKKAANPSEIFYVADSLTGQDAIKTATSFKEKIGIDGVILSKYDGDSKGGIALGLSSQVQVPLRFIGSGEKMQDLEVFIPERIVNRLMGFGDIEGLAEKTSSAIDEAQAKKLTKKIQKGKFNYNDFLEQMESMKKMGSMSSLMGMIPGMGNMSKAIKDFDFENSSELKNIKAMVSSMTLKERENPELLNNSRKQRIAAGCGLTQVEINRMIKQFKNAGKMAKKFSGPKGMKDLQAMMGQMGGAGAIPR
ncbi:MAG: signal recognition particle protein [Epsilonproteobacteria bacterium]|nr:signal recognition particle protein [Campylobacterota bacterium]OIO17135.1 MAG: signal recognition particle protein [Helicobacteraceae bacterium CG1_02_36_14]PIP10105.1 MAG: signal recognition particle protein [Sulfurimonas sp. CG23_combo_of_CG06-09_8_20_14_all_36_33]PIS26576.1 MAG: signal recognition particle protein [Sulfurimonas sp. CG08_land_8_20_14_0_20_36_33]PIU34037.1 MAG: signal recognition particle protein [Sulfurimonas sp. CG07_land_8_20_14_0_80_36_56]PIV03865.1 MAG: signal recogn